MHNFFLLSLTPIDNKIFFAEKFSLALSENQTRAIVPNLWGNLVGVMHQRLKAVTRANEMSPNIRMYFNPRKK